MKLCKLRSQDSNRSREESNSSLEGYSRVCVSNYRIPDPSGESKDVRSNTKRTAGNRRIGSRTITKSLFDDTRGVGEQEGEQLWHER